MPEPTLSEPARKRHRRGHNLLRNLSTMRAQQHPLGVRPSGNALLLPLSVQQHHDELMGLFRLWPDELILLFITNFLSGRDLLSLGHTSRILYAYTYHDDIWRRLFLSEECQNPWRGSWRKSYWNTDTEALVQCSGSLLCSDTLYRPFQCAQIDYTAIIDPQAFHDMATIKRITSPLSAEKFAELVDEPFILVGAEWPKWTVSELVSRFGSEMFRAEDAWWPLSQYASYMQKNSDEAPLYLFDCKSSAHAELSREYSVPKAFGEDMFSVLETAQCRPDFRWIIIGPARSGSTFHKDPNGTCAWNAAVKGRKFWVMYPPGAVPAGVSTDDAESEVTSPTSVAEWFLAGFFRQAVEDMLAGRCVMDVCEEGEMMYVPAGWWHTVVNMDESIAITQNFVPRAKLGDVLKFFKDKADQLSGFEVGRVRKALGEEELGEASKAGEAGNIEECDEGAGELQGKLYGLFCKLLEASEFKSELTEAMAQLERRKQRKWIVPQEEFSFGFSVDD